MVRSGQFMGGRLQNGGRPSTAGGKIILLKENICYTTLDSSSS